MDISWKAGIYIMKAVAAAIRDSQVGGYIIESKDIYHVIYLTYYVYSGGMGAERALQSAERLVRGGYSFAKASA